MKKRKTFDSVYFRGKSNFEEDGTQNYLVFQSIYKYFKRANNTNNYTVSWKSKGLSDENIKSPSTPNNFLNPKLSYDGNKIGVIFSRSCLKQDKIMYYHKKSSKQLHCIKMLISAVFQH